MALRSYLVLLNKYVLKYVTSHKPKLLALINIYILIFINSLQLGKNGHL